MLRVNDKIEISIEKIVPGGEGLGYYNELAIFVPLSIPGDKVAVQIISVKKNYARGLITSIITPSPDRISDISRLSFEDLQGCDFGMMTYEAQLRYKHLMVADVMGKIGGFDASDVVIHETLASPDDTHYRNKVIEPFGLKIENINEKKESRVISGFFSPRSHNIFEVDDNVLNSTLGNEIISALKHIINSRNIINSKQNNKYMSVYDEKTHTGILRHIMVRTNEAREAMVVLVVNDIKVREAYASLLRELMTNIPAIKSCYVSLNNARTNVALGRENILVAGESFIHEEINGIIFNISPLSFFQINVKQAKNLYNLGIKLLGDIENKTIVDAYSGTGTIAMLMAKHARRVYAIESIKSATIDGQNAARDNNICNIDFINGKVEEVLPKMVDDGTHIDAIVFDPPRKGIERNVLESVAASHIPEIVYISCNPATFARDVRILADLGYNLGDVTPVDMFPQTSHTEVVALLSKLH